MSIKKVQIGETIHDINLPNKFEINGVEFDGSEAVSYNGETPFPVEWGGTGANNAVEALNKLNGQTKITYGTEEPSGGSDGDMYLQIVEDDDDDSGWVVPTLTSSFVAYSTAQYPAYRKIGKMVEVRGAVKPTAAIIGSSDWVTIFTLPEGYIPSQSVQIVCQGSGLNTWLFGIDNSGNVKFSRYKNLDGYTEAGTAAWLTFQAMFFVD